jgi:hypothetical protein
MFVCLLFRDPGALSLKSHMSFLKPCDPKNMGRNRFTPENPHAMSGNRRICHYCQHEKVPMSNGLAGEREFPGATCKCGMFPKPREFCCRAKMVKESRKYPN